MAHTDINWERMQPMGLELNGMVYMICWRPNTLADRIVCALEPFPSPSHAPGFRVDGDHVTELSAQEAQDFKSSWSPEAMDESFRRVDQREEENFRRAIASEAFLSLPVITLDEMVMFAKKPRSVKEIENLIKVKGKPYVVELIGRTEDQVVLCRHGANLTSWVINKAMIIPWQWRDQWALDLARGLQVLHSSGITHQDLSTNNALYIDNCAIISDLEAGPLSYYPPELETNPNSPFEKPADIFQFGLLLWSVQNRNMPRPNVWSVLAREGTYATVMDSCLAMDPVERPTIDQVVDEMTKLFSDKYPSAG